MNNWPEYPETIGVVQPGRPFFMLNYSGLFMRVTTGANDYKFDMNKRVKKVDFGSEAFPNELYLVPVESVHALNDANHVPIVNLTTGLLTWMSKDKPCRVY